MISQVTASGIFISLWDIQWGSEIQTSLDFELSKRGWVANKQDFEWDLGMAV